LRLRIKTLDDADGLACPHSADDCDRAVREHGRAVPSPRILKMILKRRDPSGLRIEQRSSARRCTSILAAEQQFE